MMSLARPLLHSLLLKLCPMCIDTEAPVVISAWSSERDGKRPRNPGGRSHRARDLAAA
jgi:hypothetical protein